MRYAPFTVRTALERAPGSILICFLLLQATHRDECGGDTLHKRHVGECPFPGASGSAHNMQLDGHSYAESCSQYCEGFLQVL